MAASASAYGSTSSKRLRRRRVAHAAVKNKTYTIKQMPVTHSESVAPQNS